MRSEDVTRFAQREAELSGQVARLIDGQAGALFDLARAHVKREPDNFDGREAMLMRYSDLRRELHAKEAELDALAA